MSVPSGIRTVHTNLLAMLVVVFFAVFCSGIGVQGSTTNYCDPSLCSSRTVHVACGNDGSFASSCKEDREIVDISSLEHLIVSIHNNYRSYVAAGNLTGFLPAVRMGTMRWDAELANLAELNVKRCKMANDECRSTDRFKYAGQNVAWYWSGHEANPKTVVEVSIYGWYEEHHGAKMSHIDKYKPMSLTIDQFTTLVNDRNIRVGCALLRKSKRPGKEYFFTCNYAQTNIKKMLVYKSGPVTSKCVTGWNNQYPGLCSENEPINPNTLTYE